MKSPFRSRALIALLIGLASGRVADAQDEAPLEAAAVADAPPVVEGAYDRPTVDAAAVADGPAPVEATPAEPRVHTYALGLGLLGSRFVTERGQRMGLLAPTLVFDYAVGRRFGFGLHGAVNFPVHGRLREDGQATGVNLVEMYDKRMSFDAMFLFLYRMHPTDTLDLVFGGGVHVHTLRLVDPDYNALELISGGLGGLARAEVRLSDHFFYAGQITAAFDPVDFVRHDNRAVFVAPVSLTFAVGARR